MGSEMCIRDRISTNEKKYFMSISVLKELVTTWKAETEKGDELCKIPVY